MELCFSEIMQYKVEKRIHFEFIPTSTSRDELSKLVIILNHIIKGILFVLAVGINKILVLKNINFLCFVNYYSHDSWALVVFDWQTKKLWVELWVDSWLWVTDN